MTRDRDTPDRLGRLLRLPLAHRRARRGADASHPRHRFQESV